MGDNGQACIANTGHANIAPISFATYKSGITLGTMSLDACRWRWAAPELQRPEEYDMSRVVVTKSSDIYGMGMVIYEVSPRNSFPSSSFSTPQVLTHEPPFREYNDTAVLTEIQNGNRPSKPANAASLGITGSIWMLLEQCWDWEPSHRPESSHVLNVLREARQFGDAGAATPAGLKLKMKYAFISPSKKRKGKPYATFQYGPRPHTTSRAIAAGGNKYIWYESCLVSGSLLSNRLHTGMIMRVGQFIWINNVTVRLFLFNCSIVAFSDDDRSWELGNSR